MTRRDSGSLSDTKVDYEYILKKDVGHFGKYQIVYLCVLAIPCMASGFQAADYVFTAAKLTHRCAVPECDGASPDFAPTWIINAIPTTTAGDIQDCARYAIADGDSIASLANDTCPQELFNATSVVPCDSYVYESTHTVVYDFGLECKEWLRALAGTMNSMGGFIVLPIAGYISDNFGRRTSIVFFAFNEALVGVIRAFSVNYAMYVALQFLQIAVGGGIYSAAYILAAEIVGPQHRVVTSATMSSAFAIGQAIVGVVAFSIVQWRYITITLFVPVFLIVSYRWLIEESHRWLYSKNKTTESIKVLEKAANMNGRSLSEESVMFLQKSVSFTNVSPETKNDEMLLIRVIKSRVLLKRCCTTPVWWMATTLIYYGLSINSVSLLGNMYFNYVASALVEVPGYWTAVLVLDRIGRKTTIFTGYTICGICCISFSFVSNDYPSISLVLYLVGKFSIAAVFTSLYLYTSELYPTRHRHSFVAFSSMIGRFGSILAPLTPPLMVYWQGIPSALFGTMALISGALVLTQPETLNCKLPDTLEDAEVVGTKASYSSS